MISIDRRVFGRNLARLREEAGYSTYAVGQALGVGLTAARAWEHGERLPSLDTLVSLCALLDCCPDDLLQSAVIVAGPGDVGTAGGEQQERG